MKRIHQTTRLKTEERFPIAPGQGRIAEWLATVSRSGTTLTEVLVSILVMSIGIVSLTSIFPASLARSIRASQLTNATICRYNAEALLDADRSMLLAVPLNSKAVIDPMGYNVIATDRAALKDVFGNDGTNPSGTLARLNGGRTTQAAADFLVTLPDSWTLVTEGAGSSPGATSVTVTGLANFFPSLPGSQLRVTLFYEGSGRTLSVSRIATGLAPSGADATLSWADNLPAAALAGLGTAPKVRVDQQNRNYTWMVTAKRSNGTPDTVAMDVVVFFRRIYATEDEIVHGANFRSGTRDVTITFGASKPVFKKGSYVFDPVNAIWYRISDITSQTATAANIQLDRPASAASTQAIIMKNIVEVFHIADKRLAL